MGFLDEMADELLENQEQMQESLNLKAKSSKKKVDLHVTLPESTKKKLEQTAKKRNLSIAVLIQLLIDEHC